MAKNILDLLEEDGIIPKETGSTHGGEYKSSCPGCGGKDRFCIWPNRKDGPAYWCRRCRKSGNAVNYLMDFRHMNYHAACSYVGITPQDLQHSVYHGYGWKPQSSHTPPDKWRNRAGLFVENAESGLWGLLGANIRQWLGKRGLTEQTIRLSRLGCSPPDIRIDRQAWGLPEKLNQDGKPSKLFLPEGLVIPYFRNGQVQRLRVRRFGDDGPDEPRYRIIAGSSTDPMVLGAGDAVIVVESELDAILLQQEAGDLIGVVALGSAQLRPDAFTTDILRRAKVILVALDSDEAGAREAREWWLTYFRNSIRWPVPASWGKDPTEARMKGLDLRKWVSAGLDKFQKEYGVSIGKPQEVIFNTEPTRTNKLILPTPHILANDKKSLDEAIDKIKNSKVIALSIETTGPDFLTDKIKAMCIKAEGHPVVVVDLPSLKDDDIGALKALLAGPAGKVFHDAKFHFKFLRQSGFRNVTRWFDTMLTGQLLTAGITNNECTVRDLALRYIGPASERCVTEAETLSTLFQILATRLEKEKLWDTVRLEHECIPAVMQMEINGMLVDMGWCRVLEKEFRKQYDSLRDKFDGVNPNDQLEILTILRDKGIVIDDTKNETLLPLAEHYLVIEDLMSYRKVSKALEFVTSLIKHVHPKTGRIHPEYLQIGTATGRFSCKNPNLQQVPRDKRFRELFIPAPGYKLIIADYSQIELRIAAEISQDERMLDAYTKGLDLHKLTASVILRKPIDQITQEERQNAKPVNFGLIYAMGANGLKAYAQDAYGIQMTLEQANSFRRRFFEYYKWIAIWHLKEQAAQRKETHTLGGRRRQWADFPKITEVLNSPVQGTGADILKRALAMLPKALKGTDTRIIACVHDEILLEAPVEKVEQVAVILKTVMENVGAAYLKSVPVEVAVCIADNWAEK